MHLLALFSKKPSLPAKQWILGPIFYIFSKKFSAWLHLAWILFLFPILLVSLCLLFYSYFIFLCAYFYIIMTQAITFLACIDWSKVFLHTKLFWNFNKKVLRIVGRYFEVKNVTASGAPSRPQTPYLQINVPANWKKEQICQNSQILLYWNIILFALLARLHFAMSAKSQKNILGPPPFDQILDQLLHIYRNTSLGISCRKIQMKRKNQQLNKYMWWQMGPITDTLTSIFWLSLNMIYLSAYLFPLQYK